VEHVERKREMSNAYRIFVGKLEEMRQFGRSGRRWEDNFKMCLK